MKPFNGKTILITGGTKGLGLACAEHFVAKGAEKLLLSYRSDEGAAREAKEKIRALGAQCETFACDLSEEGASEKLFQWVNTQTKNVDVYVHNAAATAFKDLLEIQSHHVAKTFNISVTSLILNVQKLVPLMPSGGAVVTVSGMDTLRAAPKHGLLGAAKSALETLTGYFAHELAPKGIRVNGVNPGFLSTDSTRKYLGPYFESVNKFYSGLSPLKRGPRIEEVAAVIAFLASDEASWIVGQVLNVDGGQDFAVPSKN